MASSTNPRVIRTAESTRPAEVAERATPSRGAGPMTRRRTRVKGGLEVRGYRRCTRAPRSQAGRSLSSPRKSAESGSSATACRGFGGRFFRRGRGRGAEPAEGGTREPAGELLRDRGTLARPGRAPERIESRHILNPATMRRTPNAMAIEMATSSRKNPIGGSDSPCSLAPLRVQAGLLMALTADRDVCDECAVYS